MRQLQIDLSGSEQGRYHLTLDGKVLGSSVAANASYIQPAEKPHLDLRLNLIGLEPRPDSEAIANPDFRIVPKIEVQLSGELDRPSSFSGSISAAANRIRYQDYVIGASRSFVSR